MFSNERHIDAILKHAASCYNQAKYPEALCAYIHLQNLVTMRHNHLAPCRMFRNKPYLRIFKAELYSSIAACLVQMKKLSESREIFECSLKLCPTSLAYQRLILLSIRANQLSDAHNFLAMLLKPNIIRQSTSLKKPKQFSTQQALNTSSIEVSALNSAIFCFSGSVLACLNTMSLAMTSLLHAMSRNRESLEETKAFSRLPPPEELNEHEKFQCQIVFLALCNALQTLIRRGVALPLRCDYNIEELILLLHGTSIDGLCLNTISNPSFTSHQAHDAFLKYGGDVSIPGVGFDSLETVYFFCQFVFPGVFDSASLPMNSGTYFTDLIFSSTIWDTIASSNLLYNRLKDQTVTQNNFVKVVDDADLMLYIHQTYELKPLSCLFVLSDSLITLIVGNYLNTMTSLPLFSEAFDTVAPAYSNSTTLAKIMRSKENSTVRAFILSDNESIALSLHSRSTSTSGEPVQSKANNCTDSSCATQSFPEATDFNESTREGIELSLASRLLLKDLQVSSLSLSRKASVPLTASLPTASEDEPVRRMNSAPVAERTTVATRAARKVAERVHLTSSLRPKECESYQPSYAQSLELLSSKWESTFGCTKQYRESVRSRTQSISLPFRSLSYRSEMTVPNVCLSTLKHLIPKKTFEQQHENRALLCTNLPVYKSIERVRPLAANAAVHNDYSLRVRPKPKTDVNSFSSKKISFSLREQNNLSLSLLELGDKSEKLPILKYPTQNCTSCPAACSRERTRKVSVSDQQKIRRLHDVAVAAGRVPLPISRYRSQSTSVLEANRTKVLSDIVNSKLELKRLSNSIKTISHMSPAQLSFDTTSQMIKSDIRPSSTRTAGFPLHSASSINRKPVKFTDYLLDRTELTLIHGETRYERRTLFHSRNIPRNKQEPQEKSLSYTRPSCKGVPAYIPNFQDPENTMPTSPPSQFRNSFTSRPMPNILRSVALELSNQNGLQKEISTETSTTGSSFQGVSSASIPNTDSPPDVHLHKYSLSKRARRQKSLDSSIFRKRPRRAVEFADILRSTLSTTSADEWSFYLTSLKNSEEKKNLQEKAKATELSSLAPKRVRRLYERNLRDVLRRAPLRVYKIKILRLRTAAFLFRIPL